MGKEISLRQVKIEDNFWSQMQDLVTDVVIPFQERVLNDIRVHSPQLAA